MGFSYQNEGTAFFNLFHSSWNVYGNIATAPIFKFTKISIHCTVKSQLTVAVRFLERSTLIDKPVVTKYLKHVNRRLCPKFTHLEGMRTLHCCMIRRVFIFLS